MSEMLLRALLWKRSGTPEFPETGSKKEHSGHGAPCPFSKTGNEPAAQTEKTRFECRRRAADLFFARINDDIQLAVSSLLREIKDPRVQQGMISVTRVETTGDLRYCKIWLSVYGLNDEKEFMKGLRSASGWLRRELGSTVRLRYTPELVFALDQSIEYGAHISKVIDDLEKNEAEQNEN